MKLIAASTIAAFGALTAANSLQLKHSFLSLSSNEALALLDPPTLQEQLDRRCRNEAQQMCSNGHEKYCNLSDIFARFSTGTAHQQTKDWRCFLAGELDFEQYGESCVDNCGNAVMCLGVNMKPSVEHITRARQLTQVIQAQKPIYCKAAAPSLQESLNRKCYERAAAACAAGQSAYCKTSMYARYDITPGSTERQWRCYASRSLSFTHYGSGCVDACGNMTVCQGTAREELNPPPLDHKAVILETINSSASAYCDSQPLTLQGVLDRECNKMGKQLCASKRRMFCGVGLLARKDYGHSGQREQMWRCYAETALTYDQYSPRCVDNCGNMINCLGYVSGSTSNHITRDVELTRLIEANKNSYCSKTKHLYTPIQEPMPEEPKDAEELLESSTQDAPDSSESPAGAETAPTLGVQAPTTPEPPSDIIPEVEQAPRLLVGPGPPRVPGTGNLQEVLDALCIEKFAKTCLTDESFCDYAVARKDTNGWHCVAYKELDYRQSADACVDICGNIISCLGKDNGAVKRLAAEDAEEVKNQYEGLTCKLLKRQHADASH